MDLAELRTILSAAFIVFGATVFYIASLVSGHNIYKDLEYKIAILLTIIIGFILFIFSPLCFVILFPELFCLDRNLSLSPTNAIDNLCCPSSYILRTINAIHDLILGHLFWSFLLTATGLGLVFGCLSAIKARTSFLHWIRSKTGLKYPIYTYGLTWDHLLMRVKSHGRIRLKAGEDLIDGELLVSSIKEEQKQVILRNYRKISPDSPSGNHPSDGEILVTEFAQIKEIHVPSESFNLHYDMFSHSTQALYLACAALGLTMLAGGFKITASFLAQNFERLSTFYVWGTFLLLGIAVAATAISIMLSRIDFKRKRTAFYLTPFVSGSILLNIALISIGTVDTILTLSNTPVNFSFISYSLLFSGVTITAIIWHTSRTKMRIIEKFLDIVSDSTTALLAGSDNGEPYRTILDVRMYPERLAAWVDACRGQLPNFLGSAISS